MDQFKAMILKRVIEIGGNLVAAQLTKPDFEARERNIEQYYERLMPRPAKPKPTIEKPVSSSDELEQTKMRNLIEQVCGDLPPSERGECEKAVKEFMENPKSMEEYLSSR